MEDYSNLKIKKVEGIDVQDEKILNVFRKHNYNMRLIDWHKTEDRPSIQKAFQELHDIGIPHEDIYNFVENYIYDERDQRIEDFKNLEDPEPVSKAEEERVLAHAYDLANRIANEKFKSTMMWFENNFSNTQPI